MLLSCAPSYVERRKKPEFDYEHVKLQKKFRFIKDIFILAGSHIKI